MADPYLLVSRDAQQALTEFSDAFYAALVLGPITPWSAQLGYAFTSKAIRTVFPLPISAAGYKERKGDDKLRHLYERSLQMRVKEWYDGIEERRAVIEAPDFIGWLNEPARIAAEAARLQNVLVADVLASNPLLDFYRYDLPGGAVASAINLFHASHPINVYGEVSGTFDNDLAVTGIDEVTIKALKLYFDTLKGANGRELGLELTHLLIPSALGEIAKDFFERDALLNAVTNVAGTENVGGVVLQNRHKGTVTPVKAPELTGALPSGASGSSSVFYGIASGGQVAYPWVAQDTGTPEEIRYDTDSDFYKGTGKLGVKFIKTCAAAAALPHAIVRCTIS